MTSTAMLISACSGEIGNGAPQTETVAPSEVSLGDYSHESLSEDLLLRVRAITDVFEAVDGISYEQAVDLYRRDQNPEAEILIWEEMALAYDRFCSGDLICEQAGKRQEVYKAVLLASMFPEVEVADQLDAQILTAEEIDQINHFYRLDPKPVRVTPE